MKKAILLPIILLFLASFVLAQNVDIKINAIVDEIFEDETAEYNLTIINQNMVEDKFQLTGISTNFVIRTVPKLELVEIPANSFEKFMLYIKPRSTVEMGPYRVPFKIKSLESGDIYAVEVPVRVMSRDEPDKEYPLQVALTVTFDTKFDPRESIPIQIHLKNRNMRDIPELTVMIEGGLFSKTYTTSLGPREEKGSELLFDINPLAKPDEHELSVKVLSEDNLISTEEQSFKIIHYVDTKETSEQKKSFFKIDTTYSFMNNGNSGDEVIKKFPAGHIKKWFVSTEPEAEWKNVEGEKFFEWRFILSPQGEYEIKVTENYRLPVIIVIVIVIIILLYFFLRSPIVCKKDALPKLTKGGVSEVKVKIFVKNRTRKKVNNVRIIDIVPPIAEIEQTASVGTLHPTKIIKSNKKGTIVKWDLTSLDPYEERIITYNIKSRLKIIGGLSLPSTRVKFESTKGADRAIASNEVNIKRN